MTPACEITYSEDGHPGRLVAKAHHLLVAGSVRLKSVTDDLVLASVRSLGDGGVYDLRWEPGSGWRCSCPCRFECSHEIAAGLVTSARGGDA
jgi:hypothetical protein